MLPVGFSRLTWRPAAGSPVAVTVTITPGGYALAGKMRDIRAALPEVRGAWAFVRSVETAFDARMAAVGVRDSRREAARRWRVKS